MANLTVKGVVVSNKPDKTVVVQLVSRKKHKRYGKVVKVYSKCYAHDEDNVFKEGDTVCLQPSRPISALKRWIAVADSRASVEEGQ